MVIILKYVLYGVLFYIVIIPILEQLSALICQGLEVLKGFLVYRQAITQNKVDTIDKTSNEKTNSMAIGFAIPSDDEEDQEENDD